MRDRIHHSDIWENSGVWSGEASDEPPPSRRAGCLIAALVCAPFWAGVAWLLVR